MIHKHNNQEHERIMDTAGQIRTAVDSLYKEYHNGDSKLNNHIKVLSKYSDLLIDRLEHHVQSTEELDDVYANYQKIIKFGRWFVGIGGAVLTGWLLRHITI